MEVKIGGRILAQAVHHLRLSYREASVHREDFKLAKLGRLILTRAGGLGPTLPIRKSLRRNPVLAVKICSVVLVTLRFPNDGGLFFDSVASA